MTHQDFVDGYLDGLDRECPEPNENRSQRYKHSFWVGRNELNGDVKAASTYRAAANKAAILDDSVFEPHHSSK